MSSTTIQPPPPTTKTTTTPPRGRLSARYPATLGRVPLHRRGTSKTYERLEDLLREAGYKETRVFTPEGERAEAAAVEKAANDEAGGKSKRKRTSVRGSVGAVVEFLAAFMPGVASRNSSLQRTSASSATDHTQSYVCPAQEERGYSPPPSPLTHTNQHQRRYSKHTGLDSGIGSTTTLASSSENLQITLSSSSSMVATTSASTARPSRYHQRLIASQRTYNSSLVAGTHLRCMASEPHISLPHHHKPQIMSDSDDADNQPPLPATWLESVARAVLTGGTGAHFGGPNSTLQRVIASTRPPLRQTRSSISQPGRIRGRGTGIFSHYTIANGNVRSKLGLSQVLLAPPPLCARMQTERAGTSEGKVSRTAVVCRSAPVSRSGSRVRGGRFKREVFGHTLGSMNVEGKEKRKRNKKRKNRQKPKDGVPTLANTKVEGDVWGSHDGTFGVTGGEASDEEDGADDEGPSSSDSDLDLARILVPPKRQNSIRSLRKHLHGQDGGILKSRGLFASRSGTTTPAWTDREEDGYEGWGRAWRRKRERRDSVDEEEERYGVAGLFVSGECSGGGGGGGSAVGKRRRGIPGAWVGWTSGRLGLNQ